MRLLIVDDHEVVRRGIRSLLSKKGDWEVCGEAVDGLDALVKARELKPDLIVMDVSMPQLNGLEATRQVRSMLSDCEVVILSQHESSEMARQALKAGARGYVVKSSISNDLIAAITKVSQRGYFFDPAILEKTSSAHTDIQEILQRSAAFERELKISADHLQLVTNSMAASVTRCGKDLRYMWANQGYGDWLCKPVEEIIGNRIIDVLGQEAFDKLQPYFNRVLCGERVSYEEQVTFASVGRRWISATYTPTFDSAGAADGWIAVVLDVTERKQTEEVLRESQEQLALALNSTQTAIFDWDLMERRGKWNPQMSALYEFAPEGDYISGDEWLSLFHPEDVKRLTEEADRAWRGRDEQFKFEFRTVRRNGEIRWMLSHGHIVRDSNGKAVRMIGTHSDITQRKQTEAAVATRARQQKALFHFADHLHRAGSFDEVYRAALNAILDALQCNRASILLCDDAGIMRFASWRSLSTEYRTAVDGHSAWKPDERNPQPICISDVGTSDFTESLKATLKKEGINALAFIPLISGGKLDGKFMAYFNKPHEFNVEEIAVSLTIARQLAFGIERLRGAQSLRQSEERFRTLSTSLESEVRARTKELEDKNANLLRQSEQLRELSHALFHAQDEERRRIARELHDSAGQLLVAVRMSLDQAARDGEHAAPAIVRRLVETQALVQQLNREIRTTSYLLHPPLLDETGLLSALRLYLEGLNERGDVAIALEIPEDFGRLPVDIELAIFRVVQECVTNIHRHAGSKTALIRVSRGSENICVEAKDQGRGIAPERLAEVQAGISGFGLRGIQERLRQFSGAMRIESDGTGTCVTVNVPVRSEVSSARKQYQGLAAGTGQK